MHARAILVVVLLVAFVDVVLLGSDKYVLLVSRMLLSMLFGPLLASSVSAVVFAIFVDIVQPKN